MQTFSLFDSKYVVSINIEEGNITIYPKELYTPQQIKNDDFYIALYFSIYEKEKKIKDFDGNIIDIIKCIDIDGTMGGDDKLSYLIGYNELYHESFDYSNKRITSKVIFDKINNSKKFVDYIDFMFKRHAPKLIKNNDKVIKQLEQENKALKNIID